jgi:hypothetical protein
VAFQFYAPGQGAVPNRHGVRHNLIKIGVAKYNAGGVKSDVPAADVLAD